MRGKGCAAHSSSTNFPHLHPISFKNSNSKSIPANPNPNPNHANLLEDNLLDFEFEFDFLGEVLARVPDEDVGGVQSKAANVEGDTSLQKDVHASLFASVSAVEEEVTRTLVRMNGGNVATEKEFSRKNTTVSAPTACTSSSTAKGINSDSAATAKFEGFDVRSDLVPTLQKIWRNHGNIIQNSTMRNSDIIARALESLATMVDILENNPIQSLSDFQAGYLSSALSDLKNMGFKMHWLVLFVEKAVKLHKSKALVDSLNKLRELSSHVKERRDILVDDVAKLNEEENKLEKEMAKVSNLIPFSEQVKFDKPLGSGLT